MLNCNYMKHFMRSIIFLLLLCGSSWAATSTLNTSGSWSTATNWTPSGVPGSTVDAVVNGAKYANVSTNVGSIKTLTLGNSSGDGAINMLDASGVLRISNGINVCLVVGGPGVADTDIVPYPSYYSHVNGDFSTTGDMVIGTNSLSGQAFFNQGNLSVGGCLRVGAQTSGVSQFKINGGGSGVSSLGANQLEVGSKGRLVFDYLGGAGVLPLSVTNQVTLSSGSTLVVTNTTVLHVGTYNLINGGSLSGTFSTTDISGLPPYMSTQIQYDTANGDVNLVVSNSITAFDNYSGDGVWSQDNWYPSYPDGTSFGRLEAFVWVTSPVEIGYLEIGTTQQNYGLNIWDPAGSLTLNRPVVSLIVGVANNGGGGADYPGGIGYPNYYHHAAGSLTTVGDMILGANSGKVEALFTGGSIQVGGTLRLGSYQNSGASVFQLQYAGGTIGVHDLEIGSAGKLVFDYMGGVSLKTINVTGQALILSGAKLSIKNTSSSPVAITPTTYTLVQAASIIGSFSQVEFSGFPSSVVPRIVYSGGQIQLVVESASEGAPVLDPGTFRLSGYSRVAPIGTAGYAFGSSRDGEDVYFSDFALGTITRVSGGVSTNLKTGLTGIYGLSVKGDKMYFAREYDTNWGTSKVFVMNKSGTTWGDPVELVGGLTRPRGLFIESSGTLLLAVEALAEGQAGAIVRIDPATRTWAPIVTGLFCPQSAVSDASGSLYFDEYGLTTADGTPTLTGRLWKIAAGTTTRTKMLEGSRLRGLALVPGSPDQLVQMSEASDGDEGNSSTTTILTTSGTLLRKIEGVDYPQMTGGTSSGVVVTTCPRDEALLSILPNNSSGSDVAIALRTGVDSFASVRGLTYRSSGDGRTPVTITGMKDGSLTFYVSPDSTGKFAGWIRMTKAQWPNVSTSEVYSYMPGWYNTPQPEVQSSTGTLNRLQIFPHRSRNISRWPMTGVGTGGETAQPGFSEIPDAYLAYIEISGLAAAVATISWDAGGTDALWSTAANWSGNVLPGASDDVLLNAGVYVTSAVGPVGNVVVGNASATGALNMIFPGSLSATSLTIGAANNAGGGTGYPNYFYGNGGNITTTGDFVIGANGAKIYGSYTWGDITVGGALKIGAGYSDPGDSTLLLRGASSTITSGSLTIGGGVKLIMDYDVGTSIRTLTSTGAVTLQTGSSIKIVGNSSIAAGANPRLIDGAPGQLSGTFSNVTFEGFSSSVVPSLAYNSTDGDVWLVISARPPLSWDAGGGADQKWSTVANWSGDVLPGSGDDVLLNGGVQVTTAVGPVGNVVVGNASATGALNMIFPGSLSATSLTIGAANNAGGGTGYPNYFYGNGGNITTTGDFVIGANGAKIYGSYTWGDITVGGALKIGAGYSDPGDSTLLLRGASSTITSGSLTIGGGVKLIMDYDVGTSIRTLTSTGAVTLQTGSSIKIVGNSSIAAGANPRLIDGAPGQLSGTFSSVTFEGFSSSVVPSLAYNNIDGDVWLVLTSAGTTFASWSGSATPADSTTLMTYGVGGATSLTGASEKMVTTVDASNLSITAIVRVDDTRLSVVGQSTTSLSGSWSNLVTNPTGTVSSDQSGVPTGCQRRIFSVIKGINSKIFLRLVVTLSN